MKLFGNKTSVLLLTAGVLASVSADAQVSPRWKTTPAGTQIAVGTFPMASVVTPDGKYLLVMNGGAGQTSISVIDLATAKETGRTPVPDAWLGMVMTKAGDKLYVGGGARAAVFEFSFANGALTAGRTFPVVAEKDRTSQDFVGDVRLAPDGHLLYVANVFRDSVVVMNPQSGFILSKIKTGRRPYRILFHPAGKTMYVSSWADGAIGQYDVNSGDRLANVRVGPHPTDMIWVDGGLPPGASGPSEGVAEVKARVFVTAANTNSLFVMGASESGDLTKLEAVNLALTPRQPLGMTPSAVGVSADRKQVFVACSDVNALAVVDIAGGHKPVMFMPTGAYPTAVTGLTDGRIAVLNGNSNSVQLLDAPDDSKLEAFTEEVTANTPYRDEKLEAPEVPAGNPLRAAGPIKHVVYVVRGDANQPVSSIETDYTVRLGNRFSATGNAPDPANLPPVGYLWNAASQAGLKIRNYGFQVHNRDRATADGEQVDRLYDPSLTGSTDMEYRGPDPAYPDADRAKEFSNEMGEFDTTGELPQLLLVKIGTDDKALDTITAAVAKSKFASETAIFVVTPPAVRVISPWTKPDSPDSSPYGQLSALRTIEIILGLRPMTIVDAAATPMFGVFANSPVSGR